MKWTWHCKKRMLLVSLLALCTGLFPTFLRAGLLAGIERANLEVIGQRAGSTVPGGLLRTGIWEQVFDSRLGQNLRADPVNSGGGPHPSLDAGLVPRSWGLYNAGWVPIGLAESRMLLERYPGGLMEVSDNPRLKGPRAPKKDHVNIAQVAENGLDKPARLGPIFNMTAGSVHFQTNFHQGGGFTGCPFIWAETSQEFPGPVFAAGCTVWYNMTKIVNPQNQPFTFSLRRVDCTTKAFMAFLGEVVETPQGVTHIVTLPMQQVDECRCYRLETSYVDGDIGEEPVVLINYYQMGNCNLEDPTSVFSFEVQKDGPKWRLYPNPAGDVLYLEGNSGTTLLPQRMEIFDAAGRGVVNIPIASYGHNGKLELPLSLIPGLYFYRLYYDNSHESGRFVKQ